MSATVVRPCPCRQGIENCNEREHEGTESGQTKEKEVQLLTFQAEGCFQWSEPRLLQHAKKLSRDDLLIILAAKAEAQATAQG